MGQGRHTGHLWLMLALTPVPLDGFSGQTCSIVDAHGCCSEAGYFWCGSSNRCTHGWDVCEDGLGQAMMCTHQDAASGTTYDLSPLQIFTDQTDHEVVDAWTHKSKNTTFRFNVCSNAVTPSRCVNTSGGAGEVMHGPAPAYQILSVEGESQEQCYRLGSSVSNGSNVRLGVVDTAHPARGVYVRYSHGNTCDEGTEYDSESASRCSPIVKDGESACTRSFQLNVLCANTITDLPTTAQVEELSPCAFRLTLSSVYGCPIECPTDENGYVCADRGKCIYSNERQRPECLCADGWGGSGCTKDESSQGSESDVESLTSLKSMLLATVGIMLACGIGVVISVGLRKVGSGQSNITGALRSEGGQSQRDKELDKHEVVELIEKGSLSPSPSSAGLSGPW